MSEPELVWKKSQPNLEDVFIHLMQSVADPA